MGGCISQFLLRNKPLYTQWLKRTITYLLTVLWVSIWTVLLEQLVSTPWPSAELTFHLLSAFCWWSHSFAQSFVMGPPSPRRFSQTYSHGAYGKVTQISKRGKLHGTLLNPILKSCLLMSILAKVSRTAKPRCKGWEDGFHLLMREDAESHCKGM